jgi:hypothetical protein
LKHVENGNKYIRKKFVCEVDYLQEKRANTIVYSLLKICLLIHVIEGKIEGWIEVMERRGRRGKQLLNDLDETRRCCNLKRWHCIVLSGKFVV